MTTKNKYKFSIIMSIYKVEEFIEEAIDSIIKQDIGFEENVQLILVNDGSPDNCDKICKKYKEEYPENITYVEKANGGLSSARNEGLKYVNGEYINFFDPDDILSSNTLSEVYKFFKKNGMYIDFVTIPLYLFDAEVGLHVKYKDMGTKNRIISLLEEPNNFILSSAASFYKIESIKHKTFDEEMLGSEDAKFNIELFKNKPCFGYVCEKNVKYNYRKRFAHDSNSDSTKVSTKAFISLENELKLFDINNLKEYEIYFMLYELRSRIKNISENIFKDKEEYKNIISIYKKYLQAIPNYYIYNCKYTKDNNICLAMLKFKGEDIFKLYKNNTLNVDFNASIMDININNGQLIVELIINNYGIKDVDIVAYDGNNKTYFPSETKDVENGPFDLMYGNKLIDITHYRKFIFNLDNKIIKFAIKDNSKFIPIKKFNIFPCTKLELQDNSVGLRNNGKIVYLIGRKIKITKYRKSNKRYLIESTLKILKKQKHLALLRLFNRNKKYILINDRVNKAGDNGEALFKYINKNRDDLKKITYFVIDKKSPDYKKLKKYGKVVRIGSLKHKYLFLNAKYIFSSHNYKEFYFPWKRKNYKYYSDLLKYKYIWLQHGITQNNISKFANKLITKCDYVVVSTVDEQKEFLSEKYFYQKNNIVLSGFSRYDFLKDTSKNIITLCPTWRSYLVGKILKNGINETLPNFESTDYYKEYSKILENKDLINLLKKNNYTLNFVLHPSMVGYMDYFMKFENENIKIIKPDKVIYNDIFNNSKLLITDYSSVFFDFSYLKKPIIYFQFDEEAFFGSHYSNGYFDYRKDGFGKVTTDSEELLKTIDFYFNNNFIIENKYMNRIEKTFVYNNKENSEILLESVGLKKNRRD